MAKKELPITNIMKTFGIRTNTKLNIKYSDGDNEIINKTIKYVAKGITDLTPDQIGSALGFFYWAKKASTYSMMADSESKYAEEYAKWEEYDKSYNEYFENYRKFKEKHPHDDYPGEQPKGFVYKPIKHDLKEYTEENNFSAEDNKNGWKHPKKFEVKKWDVDFLSELAQYVGSGKISDKLNENNTVYAISEPYNHNRLTLYKGYIVSLQNAFSSANYGSNRYFRTLSEKRPLTEFTWLNASWLVASGRLAYIILRALESIDAPQELEWSIKQYLGYIITRGPAFFGKKGSSSSAKYKDARKFISSILMVLYNKDLNILLTNQYLNDSKSDYAKAFMTKKNIPQKVLDVMDNNQFKRDGFTFVELDADSDLDKFKELEENWNKFKGNLPRWNNAPELRFRKLGNYRASGVYFPLFNCISIDLRMTDSFVHEYGHCLDFTYGQDITKPLSLGDDFGLIIEKYREALKSAVKGESTDEGINYIKANMDYFLTPTEVFARSFELMYFLQGYQTSFLGTKASYAHAEYKAILQDKEQLTLISNYFNKMFGIPKLNIDAIK